MGWIKQIPAWAWLLFFGALALKTAATILLGPSPSAFAIIPAVLAGALSLGLAFTRWMYWGRSEANLLRRAPGPEESTGSEGLQRPDQAGAGSTSRRKSSRRPPPALPPGISPRFGSPP